MGGDAISDGSPCTCRGPVAAHRSRPSWGPLRTFALRESASSTCESWRALSLSAASVKAESPCLLRRLLEVLLVLLVALLLQRREKEAPPSAPPARPSTGRVAPPRLPQPSAARQRAPAREQLTASHGASCGSTSESSSRGAEQDHAGQDELPVGVHVHQVHAVRERAEDERADQRCRSSCARPPMRLVPPMTTAVITCSSREQAHVARA